MRRTRLNAATDVLVLAAEALAAGLLVWARLRRRGTA